MVIGRFVPSHRLIDCAEELKESLAMTSLEGEIFDV